MRIEDLKIFSDVARLHSMNLAAEKNYTTPQNLSKIIKRIENEIGVVLFKRSKKGSELTDKGEMFYLQVEDIIDIYNSTVAMLHTDEEIGGDSFSSLETLRVLSTQGVLSFAVSDVYKKLESKGGNIALDDTEIDFYDKEKLVNYLSFNEFDIVACIMDRSNIDSFVSDIPDYDLIHVCFDEMVLVVSKDHPIGSRAMVSNRDLENMQLVSFKDNIVYGELFEFKVKQNVMTNSVSKALDLVRNSSVLGTILSKTLVEMDQKNYSGSKNLKFVRFKEKLTCSYIVLLNKKSLGNDRALHFADEMSSLFEVY